MSFAILTILGIIVHMKYTAPQRADLKEKLNEKAYYETKMRLLDKKIDEKNDEALIKYMKFYFTDEQISEIIKEYITYEIKVNGEKITSSNLNYNSEDKQVVIEITAHFNDEVYPKEIFNEVCPLYIFPDGNEITDIISIHTTKAIYSFESESNASNHSYIYTVEEMTPGEIITLNINDPRISSQMHPPIKKLEVTRTK